MEDNIAEKLYELGRIKNNFEDKILNIFDFSYSDIGWDCYDNSLIFQDVESDTRLNKELCEFLYKSGFSCCYLYHKDFWETHYQLPYNNGWRVSYNHKNGGNGLLVEEIPDTWGDETFGAIVVKKTI